MGLSDSDVIKLYYRDMAEKLFGYKHLPPELQEISKHFYDTAMTMADKVPVTASALMTNQLDFGFQNLVAAKDNFVRANGFCK